MPHVGTAHDAPRSKHADDLTPNRTILYCNLYMDTVKNPLTPVRCSSRHSAL